jgi:hypothetical protein
MHCQTKWSEAENALSLLLSNLAFRKARVARNGRKTTANSPSGKIEAGQIHMDNKFSVNVTNFRYLGTVINQS